MIVHLIVTIIDTDMTNTTSMVMLTTVYSYHVMKEYQNDAIALEMKMEKKEF